MMQKQIDSEYCRHLFLEEATQVVVSRVMMEDRAKVKEQIASFQGFEGVSEVSNMN